MREQKLSLRRPDGAILRRQGEDLLRKLRKVYGSNFAADIQQTTKLLDVIYWLDTHSLSQLYRHHVDGTLGQRIRQTEAA